MWPLTNQSNNTLLEVPGPDEDLPVDLCQGHSSLDAPSELNPLQRIPSLFETLLVPQAEA